MTSFKTLHLRRLMLSGMALCLLGASPVLRADDDDRGAHERAREALEQGRVLPLRTVLEKIERDYQGQALKVEFEQDHGRFLYKIRLLQSDGRMVKLEVNAVDGQVLEIKRKENRKDQDAHPRR
ncbi:PepSY domain-containing protein [Rhodoferax antarcticus]|nr:PepSY domain-containing protein [Rhodoferax antarcticus]APW46800.1 peptidase [Rhodoferax antarcticus]